MPLSEFLLALQTLVLVATIKMPEMTTMTPIKVANPPSTPEMRGVRNVDFFLVELLGGSVDGVSLVEELEVTLSSLEGLGTGDDGLILPVVSDGLLLAISEGVPLVTDSVVELGELECSVLFVQLTYTAVNMAVSGPGGVA